MRRWMVVFFCLLLTFWSQAVEVSRKAQTGTSPVILKAPKKHTSIGSFITAIAWSYYKKGEYRKALRLFKRALTFPETREEALKGITYCYMKLGDYENALKYSDKLHEKKGEKIKLGIFYKLKERLPLRKLIPLLDKELANPRASKNYKAQIKKLKLYALKEALVKLPPDSKDVPKIANEVLSINPDDAGALESLGWWYYKKGKYTKSSEIFRRLYKKYPGNEKYEEALVRSLLKEGKVDEALKLLEKSKLKGKKRKKLNLLIYEEKNACFTGVSRPWVDVSFRFMHKSGDEGFSELNELVYPVSLNIPLNNALLTLSFTTKRLYAGSDISSHPYAGSYYKHVPQKHHLETDLWVRIPQVSVKGKIHPFEYSLSLGTTPWGGPVSPTLTFSFELKRGFWSLELHRKPVEESILSYVGQRDPYNGKRWGRVVKTGAKGSISFSFPRNLWLSLEAGYDEYRGWNVWHNRSLEFSSSAGKTVPLRGGHLSLGLFGVFRHFERNSDFFTFGHGGYFSPKWFLMGGPFVGFENRVCRSYRLNLGASVGALYYQTRDAPKYPLHHAGGAGDYEGEKFWGLGYDLKLEVERFFTKKLLLGCSFEYSKTTNYKRLSLGLSLRYLF